MVAALGLVLADVLALLLVIASVDARGSDVRGGDTGAVDQVPAEEAVSCWSGRQSVPEYLDCLASIPLDATVRDCVLDIIGNELGSLYTYSGLLWNSSNNDAELPPGFDFKVHELVLKPYLDERSELTTEVSAGLFAMRLTQLFTRMQDAHTAVYINPILRTTVYPPLLVEAQLSDGSLEFVVSDAATWEVGSFVGRTVSTVNGKPALDYFLEVAQLRAIDRSRGAQLNRFLLRQRLYGVPPPDNGRFSVTFAEQPGITFELQWMVDVPEDACGLGPDYRICGKDELCTNRSKVMQQCFTYSPDTQSFRALLSKLGRKGLCTHAVAQPTAAAADAAEAEAAAGVPNPRLDLMTETELPEDLWWQDASRHNYQGGDDSDTSDADGDTTQELAMELVHQVEDVCEVLNVTLENGTQVSVLKLQAFDEADAILSCAEAAVDLAAEVSDGSLIVDVISNGGGYVSTGYLLNQYLYSFRSPWDSCEWYDLPKNKELDWLVELSKRELPGLQDLEQPRPELLALAQRMEDGAAALAADPGFFGEQDKADRLGSAATCLRILAEDFGSPGSRSPEKRKLLRSLYKQCVEVALPFGGDGGMDIMGYSWSNSYPDVVSEPSWDYYTDTVTKIRGGLERNFSRMTFLGHTCAAYRALYPKTFGPSVLRKGGWPGPRQAKLRQVTYLSDGLCGSTCSVSSSSPYLDGLATFVTFGGVKGEAMDITTFNGGNVATYQAGKPHSYSLWKDALDTAVDAMIYFPDEDPIAWPFAPIPMNVYKVRFAQRAQYPRALGPKALPREWYLIPASYHLDFWTSESLRSYSRLSANGRQKLFDIYTATAALPPKPLQRSASAGLFV